MIGVGLIVVLPFFILLYPKVVFNFFLSASILIPATFSSDAYKVQLLGFSFALTDIFVICLCVAYAFKSLIKEKSNLRIDNLDRFLLAFTIINIIYLLFGLVLYQDLSQAFYDSRIVFYYSILFINFNVFLAKKDLSTFIVTFLCSLAVYSILCAVIFIYPDNHPYSQFIVHNTFHDLGRISFQQDYLFIIAIPFVLVLIRRFKSKYTWLLYILLIAFVVRILLGMSRGLMFFILLGVVANLRLRLNNFAQIKVPSLITLLKVVSLSFLLPYIILDYIFPVIFKDNSLVVENYLFSRFSHVFESNNSTFIATHISNRIVMWQEGLSQVLSSGLLGYGYGYTFEIDHPEWSNIAISFIDSSFITTIIRSGLISLILLLAIFYNLKVRFVNIANSKSSSFDKLFLLSLSRSIPVLVLFSVVNVFMVFSTSVFALIFIFALAKTDL